MRREEGGGEGEMEGESHKLEHHTLLFLKRYTIPVVSPFTASSFCFIIPPRFNLTSPTVSGGRREEGREGGRERGREREREGGTYNHSEHEASTNIPAYWNCWCMDKAQTVEREGDLQQSSELTLNASFGKVILG